MRELLREFLTYARDKKNFSQVSMDAYRKDLEDFTHFLMGKEYEQVSERDVLAYLENLREEYSENSVYRKLVSLRAFYKYLYKLELVDRLPTENLDPVKPTVKIPETLEWEEVRRIMDQCGSKVKGYRDKLLIKVLLETGLLISDVLDIRKTDLKENSYKRIKYIKNGNLHFIEISDTLGEELRDFLDPLKEESDMLFYGITRQNFGARFKVYGKKAGIERKIYPNMLRNTLAKKYVGEGIEELKEKLHYETLEGTGVYMTRNFEKLREIYMKIGIGDD